MEPNIVTLLMLLTFRQIFVKASKPDSLKIDAMLPARVQPSAEVLLLDGQIVYEFNVESKKLGEGKNLSNYFPTMEFPVNAASFNRRIETETHHVFAIIFAKNKRLYYLFFEEQLADDDKLLDHTDRLGNESNRPKPAEFEKEIQGMAVDLRKVTKDIKLILCDGIGLSKATLPGGAIEYADPPMAVNLGSDKPKGCSGLTMIKKSGDKYLLMATEENLEMFKMKGDELIYEENATLNIDKDILRKKSSLVTILVAVFSIGICLLLISIAVLGIFVYRRKKSVKVNMTDNTTVSTTRSVETASRKAKK